ncbi:alcohol dehydrogenase catalytic domain-containing protein [Streptomyces flaveolus]|uniref:alcohol dehydrogenase catalytic domain-containing protein n=1 Tax=Streptomyces flaveolus TaxID=67297 RepID=UPI0033B4593C
MKPKRGEVLIKVEATGLCHSELHMLTGDWPVPLPMGGGHEATGIVEEIGPGVGRGRSGPRPRFHFFANLGSRVCSPCRSPRSSAGRQHRRRPGPERGNEPSGARRSSPSCNS